MLLVIDIGNTNMEFGLFEKQSLKHNFRLCTNHDITSDEIGLALRQFMQIQAIAPAQIEAVMIASVVPQVIYSMRNAIRKYLSQTPWIVGENVAVPLVNAYQNPSEVGSDRLINSYAGVMRYGGSLVIVDFGTATTFDVIDKNCAYLGGLIFPGIKISLDALASRASKLPKVEISLPDKVIGTSTATSMQAGLLYGYTGAVNNIIKKVERELGYNVRVIATGGLSRLVGGQTTLIDKVEPTLTLDGLQLLYQHLKTQNPQKT